MKARIRAPWWRVALSWLRFLVRFRRKPPWIIVLSKEQRETVKFLMDLRAKLIESGLSEEKAHQTVKSMAHMFGAAWELSRKR